MEKRQSLTVSLTVFSYVRVSLILIFIVGYRKLRYNVLWKEGG